MRSLIPVIMAVFYLTPASSVPTSGFYADNGLQQTVLVKKLRERERRVMQQEILQLLGLHNQPKPLAHVRRNSAPQFMLGLYETLQHTDQDSMENSLNQNLLHVNMSGSVMRNLGIADTITSFVNHASDKGVSRKEGSRHFLFDFGELSAAEVVTAAELRLYKRRSRGRHNPSDSFHVHIYRLKQGPDLEDRILKPEADGKVFASQEGWLAFNVTTAASDWQTYPTSNLGLYMTITDSQSNDVSPREVGIVDKHGSEDKQAFMVAAFKATREVHVRRTRAARKRQRSDVTFNDDPGYSYNRNWKQRFNRKACQRRTLYVRFRDLDWHSWIIAPDGYAAYYCQGECSFPLTHHMNATNHAIVQTLVHLYNPYQVPKPGCAPTKLSAISVLYFDDNSNVILRKYRNMVVRACGCH